MLRKISIFLCFLCGLHSTIAAGKCNNNGVCIDFKDCQGLYAQFNVNITSDMITLLKRLKCGFSPERNPMICCPPEFLIDYQNINLNELRFNRKANNILPDIKVCGLQTAYRIVGGTETELTEHPWMALIEYTKPRGKGFYCGGVLISERYVLTAAHCVKGPDLPETWSVSGVRLGEWNTSSAHDCQKDDCSPPPLNIPIEEAIAHEGYQPFDGNQQNDIALLRLSTKVPFSEFVTPICLPWSSQLRHNKFEDYDLEVAGWGKTETRSASDVKLKVRVPVVKNSDCSLIYSRAGRLITDKQLCAGGLSGQDSCKGDSGGPLMGQVTSIENWLALGVVSYGPSPCGTPGWPGVYTRVTDYMEWIVNTIKP